MNVVVCHQRRSLGLWRPAGDALIPGDVEWARNIQWRTIVRRHARPRCKVANLTGDLVEVKRSPDTIRPRPISDRKREHRDRNYLNLSDRCWHRRQ